MTRMVTQAEPRKTPILSPQQRRALATAARTLHNLAWTRAQVAIGLEDAETIAANVIVVYLDVITNEAVGR